MPTIRYSPLLIAAAIAIAGCKNDSNTAPSTGTPDGEGNPSTGALTISVDSGFSDRTAVVGTLLPARVHVTTAGQPAPNITVTWKILTGSGNVSSTTTTTDASGATSTDWTLGETARVNTLQATITGSSATLIAQGVAGPATTIARVTADSSAIVAGGSLLLTIRTVDKSGNPVSNVPVTWSATSGTLGTTATASGAGGRSEVTFTTNAAPASYTVTATSPGLGTAMFKIVGM